MNDRELISTIKQTGDKKLLEDLWNRYADLIHKNWAILRRQMDNSALILNMQDDFYSESYLAFRKAVDAINLEKIRDDKWKFLGYFRLYLKNVRADMISALLKRYQHEKSFYIESDDGEEIARVDTMPEVVSTEGLKFDPVASAERAETEAKCSRAVAECMAKWDLRKRQIYSWRDRGIAKSAIAAKLGVNPATITYHLSVMKRDLEESLHA